MSAAGQIDAGAAVWAEYNALVQKARSRMLARPEAVHARVRDQAEYALVAMQAGCHHFHALHRPDYPAFYRQTIWSPYEAPWGGPSSDMVYAWAFIDGRRTYRIHGRRGTTRFSDLQLFNGYFEREDMRGLGNLDFDTLQTGPDGSFSFIASAQRPAGYAGDWLPLDPTEPVIYAQLRDTWWDWAGERGIDIHIECLDPAGDAMVLPTSVTHERLLRSGHLLERTVARAMGYANMNRKLAGGQNNAFGLVRGSGATDHGASGRAGYGGMVWDIEPGEALVITLDEPQARYWSFQLVDWWWMTLDFSYHQSGLNGFQAERDPDGRISMVLSLEDPGIANWLDPIGTPTGLVQMRWYDGTVADAPVVEKIALADVVARLPGARRVNPAQRSADVAARAKASLARWGY
ncbi:DUF1214 domain-containing protein [Novosphingobium taihuense]|uniref:DUF1214 domain-containing protein n=1 Tax=Novosphingobium taihuense TaxID=260085 RepID=A0A7W7ADI6_9SPHN|nr:DUF1214 domain-containing protein [Novosphingobium taihuense]MBB4615070.1 hypothetical protein [Novosphingobium taihuense]TWH79303.1 uncharacterized protein DUF1214 [Novosphingobium taihuense]